MFNPFELGELIDLVTGRKQKRVPEAPTTRRWKLFFGGHFFGLVGALLGAKLASKVDISQSAGLILMMFAALVGFGLFLKAWRALLG